LAWQCDSREDEREKNGGQKKNSSEINQDTIDMHIIPLKKAWREASNIAAKATFRALRESAHTF
jgi:hypothetical protein